ncbi:MAG: hypothetical protein ACP5QK_02835 [Myxococcota bacterium]
MQKRLFEGVPSKTLGFAERRGKYYDINDIIQAENPLSDDEKRLFERLDIIYRTLCAVMYNYVPMSGHPGGSISSGRFVSSIIYNILDFDIKDPNREDQDVVIYAAGHKALGLYAIWALRNEIVRAFAPSELPEEKFQLRFEDLLGFRRNPTNKLPLFNKFKSKALDGHPTPATPFVKVATGASGVGVPAAFGYAFGALDYYRENPPKVHIVEGEGGMTPGRVAEALASASASRLYNAFLHIDFNQASIDSNRVCRDGNQKGDYVQWNPVELCYLHDFNVIYVDDGKDFNKIVAAQLFAMQLDNKMPTAIVYRTIKGWRYGIEGKASHGAGHKFCSEGYYAACKDFQDTYGTLVPKCEIEPKPEDIESLYYETLMTIRKAIESDSQLSYFAEKIKEAKKRLNSYNRKPHDKKPDVNLIYSSSEIKSEVTPEELKLSPDTVTTIRAALGDSLNYLNKKTGGALVAGAADLLGSTSINSVNKGFAEGFFDAVENPDCRLLSIGGICEDAMGAMMSGIAAFGKHIPSSSSYGAFIAAMEHTAARLYGIGQQNRVEHFGGSYNPWILVNAHAGLKTGEDGPTHADPQCLQLLQENFPKGILITLTPWEPGEVWPLLIAGLRKRPCILAPFVTRPNEKVYNRSVLKITPASESIKGIYPIRKAKDYKAEGTIIIQESAVMIEFINKVLPLLDKEGINLNIFYVSSAELFELLDDKKKEEILPYSLREEAMGITGFTLPTMLKWVVGKLGRELTMHPYMKGKYLGSGSGEAVMYEAGLDGESQFKQIKKYLELKKK